MPEQILFFNIGNHHVSRHTGAGGCVVIGEKSFKIVIPAKAGNQNNKLLDSVSRFAYTE